MPSHSALKCRTAKLGIVVIFLSIHSLSPPHLEPVAVDLPEQNSIGPDVGLCGELAEEDALRGHPAEGDEGLGLHPVVVRGVDIS